jgi:hypothetical protein
MTKYIVSGLIFIIILNLYYLIEFYNYINKRFDQKENIFLCPQCGKSCDKSSHDYYGACRSRWCSTCKTTFLETEKYI